MALGIQRTVLKLYRPELFSVDLICMTDATPRVQLQAKISMRAARVILQNELPTHLTAVSGICTGHSYWIAGKL